MLGDLCGQSDSGTDTWAAMVHLSCEHSCEASLCRWDTKQFLRTFVIVCGHLLLSLQLPSCCCMRLLAAACCCLLLQLLTAAGWLLLAVLLVVARTGAGCSWLLLADAGCSWLLLLAAVASITCNELLKTHVHARCAEALTFAKTCSARAHTR